jgi:uncharacterized membrane protein YphA (DoxX/SURF4 family)
MVTQYQNIISDPAGFLPDYSDTHKGNPTMSKLTLALSLVLAAGFIFFGVQKFGADNIVFETIATRSGITLFEPYIRYLTGFGELFAAVLLLLPRTRLVGTLAGLALLIGAIGFHLSPWLGINVPTIGHGLFYTALAMTALTVTNTTLLRKTGAKLQFWKA